MTIEKLAMPRFSIALLSACSLAYEVLLMRLFSIIQWHHFAYMIISLALLGYGASGTFLCLYRQALLARFSGAFLLNLLLFAITMPAAFMLVQAIPFNPLELLWDGRQVLYMLALYLILSIPFFFAANCIGLTFMQHRERISRLYAYDMLGAGLGSAGIVVLLSLAMPQDSLRFLAALAIIATALAARELRLPARIPLILLPLAMLPLILPTGWTTLQLSPYKSLSQSLNIPDTRVVDQISSPLGLLTLVESPSVPWRHAPGLSLHASDEPPPQLALFTDGDGMTAINRHSENRQDYAYLDYMTSALPYHLKSLQRVAILGAGGGSDILQARYHGVAQVDAVEINAQITDLLSTKFRAFAGPVYTSDQVRLHIREARGFIAGGDRRYDLIQVSLLDAFNAAAAGLYALNESYLYTVEAFREYLERLEPGGYLAISRWLKLPPRDALKLVDTAIEAIAQTGASNAAQRLVLIRSWQTSTLLIKNGDFNAEEIARLRQFCQQRGFDTSYFPGISEGQSNRFNQMPNDELFHGTRQLLDDRHDAFVEGYKFNIQAATDNQPYFFNFFKWSSLAEISMLRQSGGMALLEWGYLVLVFTLLQALLASVLFILLPLFKLNNKQPQQRGGHMVFGAAYFFLLGLAFLFLEIVHIQRFILFLHHPIYAVSTVLASFLIFAGLGSAGSRRYAGGRELKGIHLAISAIVVIGVGYLLLLPYLLPLMMDWPIAMKTIVTIILIAPLAYCMGFPFPLGLSLIGSDRPQLIPWLWAINGCASVISAIVATLCAIHLGFNLVIVFALTLYIAALVCLKWDQRKLLSAASVT